jgi:type II secretory pathway pseudopilin PulG
MTLQNRSSLKIHSSAHSERGFTVLQLLFVIAIIGIVSSFAVVRITAARQQMRIHSAARTFAGYVEKVRHDAIRRRGGDPNAPPKVEFLNDSSYAVTMDFAGNGTSSTRVIQFNGAIKLLSVPPQPIVFNWRGRTTLCTQTFTLENGNSQGTIDISGSGDTTVDGDPGDVPNVAYSNISNSADISNDAVVSGTTAPGAVTAGDCSGTVSGPPPPPATSPGCGGTSIAPSLLQIRKDGGSTGTFTVTLGTATTVSAAGPRNLTITPASQPISGTGSFSITSNNRSRGTFDVTFSAPCFTRVVQVRVNN